MTDAVPPLADRQIALLDELSEIGMTAARAIGRQVTAIAPDDTPIGPEDIAALESLSRAYAKVARAVRLSVMLQDRIARPGGKPAEPAREPITHIIRTIVDPRQEIRDAESATREHRERLDREGDGTPTDLIAHICRDLGLDSEWSRQAALCWPYGESVSDAPGWPLTPFPHPGEGVRYAERE